MGLSLCGAGAGGFGVVILRRDKQRQDLELSLRNYFRANAVSTKAESTSNDDQSSSSSSLRSSNDDISNELESSLTIHAVMIDPRGISTHSFPTHSSMTANQTGNGAVHNHGVVLSPPLEDYLFRE